MPLEYISDRGIGWGVTHFASKKTCQERLIPQNNLKNQHNFGDKSMEYVPPIPPMKSQSIIEGHNCFEFRQRATIHFLGEGTAAQILNENIEKVVKQFG